MRSGKFSTFHRRPVKTALASVALVGLAGLVSNASAADGTGTANATVVTPITITNTSGSNNLRFGSFSTTAAGGTVTIGTDDSRTIGGTAGTLGVGTGQNAFGAATFTVGGQANLTYAITLPTNGTVNITTGGAGPTETMAVSDFTSNPSGTGTIGGGGTQTLKVGAKITTVASQVTGVYTGTFTVTVLYN